MSNNICIKCQQSAYCGSDSAAGCWCFEYPSLEKLRMHVSGEEAAESCFCRKCLAEELNELIGQFVEDFKAGKVDNIAPKVSNSKARPIEGIDYYLENDRWVFTSWSHLKRGYCCGSGCRHCPYPKVRV